MTPITINLLFEWEKKYENNYPTNYTTPFQSKRKLHCNFLLSNLRGKYTKHQSVGV